MLTLLQRWHAGKPEFLFLAGASVAIVANAASLVLALALQPKPTWPGALMVYGTGIGLSVAAGIALSRRRSRSPQSFVVLGAVATAVCVLSYPGLIGGSLALAGATWGVAETYEARP